MRPGPVLRRLFRLPVYLYQARLGWLLGRRFLMLVHVGRRSGRTHYTVLEVMEYREEFPELVVMSGFGRKSDWLLNIQAAPQAEIVVGSRRFPATHRLLETDEAAAALEGYERRNRIVGGIIRGTLSRLLGWRYDGSEEARRRAVMQLPLVAFRPRPNGCPCDGRA